MDSLDPLSTADPTAPHTSSISSNRFLLKQSEVQPITGNILRLIHSDPLPSDFSGVWLAETGPDYSVSQEQLTALVHLQGVKLVWKLGKARVMEDSEGMVMMRLVAGSEGTGKEIGELQGVKIYSEVETEPSAEEPDVNALLQAMTGVFPYSQRVLAYYLYTQFNVFPSISPDPPSTPPADFIESISQLNLIKYRTGVPKSEVPSVDPSPLS